MGMQESIETKLAQALQPSELVVVNDSHRHKGHAGDDGSGETHFNVTVVSDSFSGKSRVARQRMIYDLLAYELQNGLHALSIKAFTPQERL
jgi:BolA protein